MEQMDFTKNPRPKFNDEILLALAKEIGQEIFDWSKENGSLEDCIADCKIELKWGFNDNGYDLAKEFENRGYSPDARLVEILDGVESSKSDLITEAVKKWVIENDIKPQYGTGTSVIVKYGGGKVEGIITGAYSETAEYKVAIPSEGMTIEGSRMAIIKFENAELITQPV